MPLEDLSRGSLAPEDSALLDELITRESNCSDGFPMTSSGTGKYWLIKYSEDASKTNGEQPESLRDKACQIQH